MKIYIRSASAISPQNTFIGGFTSEPVEYTGNILSAIEPDYKGYIDAKLIRRMSRIIRMGVAAALQCLRNANMENVDAIITGTAYGCLEDTTVFLNRIIEQQEEMLSPTAFIQSTHNTVGAQVALTLQCTGYNNTFVHKAFSFESALLDSIMLLKENEANTVLVGGIDEITKTSYAILNRFGLYKREPISNFDLINSNTKGTVAGEGATFVLLSNEETGNNLAELTAITTFYKLADMEEIENNITSFLTQQQLSINDIDYIISGRDGDSWHAAMYNALEAGVFKGKEIVYYKHLCGEYPTSSAFALSMAAHKLKYQKGDATKYALVYSSYQNTYYSLMLLSAC